MYLGAYRSLIKSPAVVAAGGAMTFVTSATGESAGSGTTSTIASLDLGTAINNRLCVAVITNEAFGGSGGTLTSVTIGGVTADISVGFSASKYSVIASAILNSGDPTTGDVVMVTSVATGAAVRCTVLTFDNAVSATPVDSEKPAVSTDNTTRTLNVTAGGVVVGVYMGGNGANAVTPTGMTEVTDAANIAATWRHAAYYDLQVATGTDDMSLDSASATNEELYASYR